MTEPQSWTLIATFTAAIFGMLTLSTAMVTRVIRGEIGSLRGEMVGEIGSLRGEMVGEIGSLRGEMVGEIGSLRGEMVALESRLGAKIELLDHDVQAIARRVFPEVE